MAVNGTSTTSFERAFDHALASELGMDSVRAKKGE
jgi:hypothetical protein